MNSKTEDFCVFLIHNLRILYSNIIDMFIYLLVTVYFIVILKIELTTTNITALYTMVFIICNMARGHLHREGIGNTLFHMSVINTKTGRPANNLQFFARSIIFFYLFTNIHIGFFVFSLYIITGIRFIERVTGTSHIQNIPK